jgi:hypothetical protein
LLPGHDFSVLARLGQRQMFETLPFRDTMMNCFLRVDRGSPVTLRPDQDPPNAESDEHAWTE